MRASIRHSQLLTSVAPAALVFYLAATPSKAVAYSEAVTPQVFLPVLSSCATVSYTFAYNEVCEA
jgi:hypothetical protein